MLRRFATSFIVSTTSKLVAIISLPAWEFDTICTETHTTSTMSHAALVGHAQTTLFYLRGANAPPQPLCRPTPLPCLSKTTLHRSRLPLPPKQQAASLIVKGQRDRYLPNPTLPSLLHVSLPLFRPCHFDFSLPSRLVSFGHSREVIDSWPHPGALAPLRVFLGLSPALSGFMPQLCPSCPFMVFISATRLMTPCFSFGFDCLTSVFSTFFVLLFPVRFCIPVSISYGLGGALCFFLFD